MSTQRTSLLLGVVLSVGALTVFAKWSPVADIHASVVSKAAQSKNGVILVLTKRGPIAAQAAYLLLAQIKQNEGFVPLFMAVEDDMSSDYMQALSLPDESLPAVIFFNKSGRELVRVVATKSVMIKEVQAQKHAD